MKFETTSAFDGDYRRLKREHADAFKTVVREKFAPACDAHAKEALTGCRPELCTGVDRRLGRLRANPTQPAELFAGGFRLSAARDG